MIYETIGDNIRRFRQERGMTQGELADLLFVSSQMISRYEKSSAAPDVAMLAKICSVFHVSMDRLCGLDRTSRDKHIQRLSERYSKNIDASFSILNRRYGDFLNEAQDILLDDRVMRIQLSLLEALHDHIENDNQRREINEKIWECSSRILDISRDDELRSYANYRMAVYYWETPFESKEYQKNLKLSKSYMQKVLMCTCFPEYTPLIGTDIHSDEHTRTQINHVEFFANKLFHAIKQLQRKDEKSQFGVRYEKLSCCLAELFE